VGDLRPDRGWTYVVAWAAALLATTAFLVRRRIS
jgi:hypothetical protein